MRAGTPDEAAGTQAGTTNPDNRHDRAEAMMQDQRVDYPGRWLVRALTVATVLCGLLVVAWLGIAAWSGDTDCEFSPGTYLYGEASVSWLPPGRTCSYVDAIPGQRHVDRPDLTRLVVLAVALAGYPVKSYLERLLKSPHEEDSLT